MVLKNRFSDLLLRTFFVGVGRRCLNFVVFSTAEKIYIFFDLTNFDQAKDYLRKVDVGDFFIFIKNGIDDAVQF